jgi:hypothetical protein
MVEKSVMKNPVKKSQRVLIFISVIVIFLVIISAIIIAGFHPIKNRFITQNIALLINKSGIDSCTIDRVILTPWKQIEFEGLYIKTGIGHDRILEMQFTHCLVQYSLASIVLHAADLVEMLSNVKGSIGNTDLPQDEIGRIIKSVAPLNVIHGRGNKFQIVQKGNNLVVFNNYRIDLNKKSEISPEYDGKIEADSGRVDKWTVTKVSADLICDDQLLRVKNNKAQFLNGQCSADYTINMRTPKLMALTCVATGLDIDKYYSIEKKYYGKIKGTADINLTLGESFFNLDSLNGKGTVIASGVTLNNLPVQKALVSLLGFPQLGFVKFDTIRTDFELKSGNNITNNMSGKGPIIGFKTIGWIKGDGNLSQNIDGVFTRDFIETLPGIVSESLQKTADNGRKFQCRIYGSLDHPKMELSKETLKKAFSGAFDSIKESIEKMLK